MRFDFLGLTDTTGLRHEVSGFDVIARLSADAISLWVASDGELFVMVVVMADSFFPVWVLLRQ
jgi:hypothetical protein